MTLAAPDVRRRRRLALMGIEVWVRRTPRPPAGAADAPLPARPADARPGAGTAGAARPAGEVGWIVRLDEVAACGPGGRYHALWRHLSLALGCDDGLPIAREAAPGAVELCFGTAPQGVGEAVLAPSLAALRASAAAKRALWPALRRLRATRGR